MDEMVLRARAKWPGVPDVYGWLTLDRRGCWLLRNAALGTFEPIANLALREFIARNYASDARGRWYFQNGPQRVFVRLAYAPFVVRTKGNAFIDQCSREFDAGDPLLDEEGSILFPWNDSVALLDDRDLAQFADGRGEALERLGRIEAGKVPERFGFVPDPGP